MCELNSQLMGGMNGFHIKKKKEKADEDVIPLPGKQTASPMWQYSPIPVGSIFPSSCWEYTTLGLQRVYISSMLQIIC